jgi:hypothetical protein
MYNWDTAHERIFGVELVQNFTGESIGNSTWDVLEKIFRENATASYEFEGAIGEDIISN